MAYESNKNKLPTAQLKNLTIGLLSAVDRPCQEPAQAVLLKRAPDAPAAGLRTDAATALRKNAELAATHVGKRSALTSATSGHTHMVYGIDESQSGFTSSESLPGKEYGWHSHPWIKNDDGSISLGEQEGHTHTVASASSTEKRAPIEVGAGNSTTAPATSIVKNNQEHSAMDKDQQIASLSQRSTLLTKFLASALTLPEAHRAHAATLSGDEAESFLAKSAAERETIVKAAADVDTVLYTRTDGSVVRKSQGQAFADVAKQADEAMKIAKAEREQRETVELHKRADTVLKHFAKGVAVRAAILKAVDGIADEAVRKDAHEALAAADAASAELAVSKGVNPGDAPAATDRESAFAALSKGLTAFAKANSINVAEVWTTGLDAFAQTTEGAALKRAYDEAQ